MSPTSTFDASTAITLGEFTHNGALAAGGSYTQSQSVTLPVAVSGTFYFIVQTDVNGQVFQNGDTAGNIGVETDATTVNLTPPPDLTIKAVVPKGSSVLAGHALSVTYTVENAGAGVTEMAAGAGVPVAWTDAFYLSPTTTLNAGTEIAIGTVTHTGSLSAGDKYTSNVTLTLPNAISGTYYLIADADVGDLVYEIDLSSKVRAEREHDLRDLAAGRPDRLGVQGAGNGPGRNHRHRLVDGQEPGDRRHDRHLLGRRGLRLDLVKSRLADPAGHLHPRADS